MLDGQDYDYLHMNDMFIVIFPLYIPVLMVNPRNVPQKLRSRCCHGHGLKKSVGIEKKTTWMIYLISEIEDVRC
jgi:hypothetical protein